jgi:hypothetical protein
MLLWLVVEQWSLPVRRLVPAVVLLFAAGYLLNFASLQLDYAK